MKNSENKSAKAVFSVSEQDCLADHKTLSDLADQSGEIFLIDEVNYGIRMKADAKPLLPCNLPDSLQKTGKQVLFSGQVKEAGLTEFWAGQPFVLTKIAEQ
jgi:hypothetical protein